MLFVTRWFGVTANDADRDKPRGAEAAQAWQTSEPHHRLRSSLRFPRRESLSSETPWKPVETHDQIRAAPVTRSPITRATPPRPASRGPVNPGRFSQRTSQRRRKARPDPPPRALASATAAKIRFQRLRKLGRRAPAAGAAVTRSPL